MALSGGKGGGGGSGGKGANTSTQETNNTTDVTTNNLNLEDIEGTATAIAGSNNTVNVTDAGAIDAMADVTEGAFDFGNEIFNRATSTITDNIGDTLDLASNSIDFVADVSSSNADLIEANADLSRRSLEMSGQLALEANRGESENIAMNLTDGIKYAAVAAAVFVGLKALKAKK